MNNINISESSIPDLFMDRVKQMGINSKEELILHLPVKYKDYRKPISNLSEALSVDESCYMLLKLVNRPEITFTPRKPPTVKMTFTDAITSASAMVFGNTSDWEDLQAGELVHMTGNVVERDYNGKIFINIKSATRIKKFEQGQIIPVYKGQIGDNPKSNKKETGKHKISPESIAANVLHALRESSNEASRLISERAGVGEAKILSDLEYPFKDFDSLLMSIHRPRSAKELNKALKTARLINGYKTMQDALASRSIMPNTDSMINIGINSVKDIVSNLPFKLTDDQRRAVWDIIQDLSSNVPMNRLVSGDVGCGKTLTYGIPAICTHMATKRKNNSVVIVLTPNSLLAMQIASELKEIAPDHGVNTRLIIDGEKKNNGPVTEATIIVGTTAVLHWIKKHGKGLSIEMLIIDEQQKLGNDQRNALIQPHTNVLQATATAIPRTTAQIMFGAMDISIIEQCPVEKHIVTAVCGTEHRKSVMKKLNETLDNKHQIAILYPTRTKLDCFAEIQLPAEQIDSVTELLKENKITIVTISSALGYQTLCKKEIRSNEGCIAYVKFKEAKRDDFLATITELEILGCNYIGECDGDVQDVEQAFEKWNKIHPGEVVMIHGGMKVNDKICAIEKAKKGFSSCKVIITSSVIEIGLTMPDLRTLLIIGAEKYGAGTLHQFRGRLARKGGNGAFIMMSSKRLEDTNEETIHRLNILKNNTKGSKIAEEDMMQRGFGSLSKSSSAQSGNYDGVFKNVKVLPSDISDLLNTTSGRTLLRPRRDTETCQQAVSR